MQQFRNLPNPQLIIINKFFKILDLFYTELETWTNELLKKECDVYSDDIEIIESNIEKYTACNLIIEINEKLNIIVTPISLFNDSTFDGRIKISNTLNDNVMYLFYSKSDIINERVKLDPKLGTMRIREYVEGWMIDFNPDGKKAVPFLKDHYLNYVRKLGDSSISN